MLTLRNLGKSFDNGSERLPLFHHLDLTLARRDHPAAGAERLRQVDPAESHRRPPPRMRGDLAGETRLDNQSADERARLRGRHFGIVYQDFNLLPTLTVAENLALPLAINQLARDETRIDGLLERLDLAHKRHAWPEQLSGGQRQRVALAAPSFTSPSGCSPTNPPAVSMNTTPSR